MKTPVIAIFDVGKTNKKLFLFNEHYQIVHENCVRLDELTDEDGFACEDLNALEDFLLSSFAEVTALNDFEVKAVNFSGYGASMVYIDEAGNALTPLYNYLKPYPQAMQQQLYSKNGGRDEFSRQTASPALGSLNSGLQPYRLKHEHPAVFNRTAYALHLPQYLSYLLTKIPVSDITSIGCHTALWNFDIQRYHNWVAAEGLLHKLAPLVAADEVARPNGSSLMIGPGLHDSSAALIPYLACFSEPFMLLSTGTWCISLNPFNNQPLTAAELEADCLCYLDYKGNAVKASRLFLGNEYEKLVNLLAAHYQKDARVYDDVAYDQAIINAIQHDERFTKNGNPVAFDELDMGWFDNDVAAYHCLLNDLVARQVASSNLVLKGTAVKQIFVDGGFGRNKVFMHLLANAYPDMEVYAAVVPQATALGAALVLHKHWNTQPMPQQLIALTPFAPQVHAQ